MGIIWLSKEPDKIFLEMRLRNSETQRHSVNLQPLPYNDSISGCPTLLVTVPPSTNIFCFSVPSRGP